MKRWGILTIVLVFIIIVHVGCVRKWWGGGRRSGGSDGRAYGVEPKSHLCHPSSNSEFVGSYDRSRCCYTTHLLIRRRRCKMTRNYFRKRRTWNHKSAKKSLETCDVISRQVEARLHLARVYKKRWRNVCLPDERWWQVLRCWYMLAVGETGGFWWTQLAKTQLNSPTKHSKKATYSGCCCGCCWATCCWNWLGKTNWAVGISASADERGTAPAHKSTESTIYTLKESLFLKSMTQSWFSLVTDFLSTLFRDILEMAGK